MNASKKTVCFSLVFCFVALGYGQQRPAAKMDISLEKKIKRFAPTVLTADTSSLAANDRKALQKIIAAAKYIDPLYLRQVWSGNEALLKKLQADKSPLGRLRLHYFMINKGPWSNGCKVSQSKTRRRFSDSCSQRGLQLRRRQQRRTNSRFQSAERRARGQGKRLEANHVEKRAGCVVQQDAGSHLARGALAGSANLLAFDEKAKAILDKYAVIRPPMKSAFDRLGDVPVDIEPLFPLAK